MAYKTVKTELGDINVLEERRYESHQNATKTLATGAMKPRCQGRARDSWGSTQCDRSGSYLEEAHETSSYGMWIVLGHRDGHTVLRNDRGEVVGYENNWYGAGSFIPTYHPQIKFYYCKQHSMEGHNAKEIAEMANRAKQREVNNAAYSTRLARESSLEGLLVALRDAYLVGEPVPVAIKAAYEAVVASDLGTRIKLNSDYH